MKGFCRPRIAVIVLVLWFGSVSVVEAQKPTYAALGQNQLRGYQLCVKHTNERGGVLGRKLELVVEDDRFQAATDNGCDVGLPTTVRSSTQAVAGSWYAVTAVKTSGAISIYVNGVLEATTTLGAFADTNVANVPEGAFLNGRVKHVALFRRALNNGQIPGHRRNVEAPARMNKAFVELSAADGKQRPPVLKEATTLALS